ncbi:tetratricopeptide repeat protein [Streptomyces sp. NPDC056464]|uniref:tetratricopeptide repeat protein n=1 Tax=Streptomyces sp. NPDC056464 TaxID=3345828 RepID=UPI0036B6C786
MTAERPPQVGHIEASGSRSIAAHSIGAAHSGDVIELPAEVLNAARDIQAPPGISNLPPRGLCLGRDVELDWLRRTLSSDSGTAITQVSTVHGLGGVGKSTLALAYAHRHRSDYTLIWWITADSRPRVEQSFADLTLRLFPAWAGKASEQERAAWAMTWLQWHPGWFLVFDNVEDARDLAPYIGALSGGHYLATSRRATGWPRTFPTYPLDTLAPDEAAALLCACALDGARPTPRQFNDARALATELGHLPLALEQAGAYLHQNPTLDIDAYRIRLGTKLDKAADGIDAERTITRIWTHTLKALNARNPLSVTLLSTLAWLAPDDIPLTLLEPFNADDDALDEALGVLHAYSMATLTKDTVKVHRLLQTVLRSSAGIDARRPPAGRREAEKVLELALATLPKPTAGTAREWDALLPHLVALAATTPENGHNDPVIPYYARAANYLVEQGRIGHSISLHKALLSHFEQFHGESHPRVFSNRRYLALAYQDAGDFARAIPLLETALAQCEQELGDTHPGTLDSRRNLALAYKDIGDLARAIPLLETTLAQCEQELGDTHPDTLDCRNSLAGLAAECGDLSRAIDLLEATTAHLKWTLGAAHPHTLTCLANLAITYKDAGYVTKSIDLYEAVLAKQEQALGETHPDTLGTRNNLALAYREKGDLTSAIALMRATLTHREKLLGDRHPSTLTSRHNLALAYHDAGDSAKAIRLFETVIAQREQALGGLHPLTLESHHVLALIYQDVGELNRAIEILETVLDQYEQVHGDTHPRTYCAWNHLSMARSMLSNLGGGNGISV